jgi:regulatory protein
MAGDATSPTAADAMTMALRYLGRREYALDELRRKLVSRGIDADIAGHVITDLADQGYVSDERYAEARVRQRMRKGYGPARIRAELREKGVSADVADRALGEFEADWYERAFRWARHWARGREPGLLDERTRARLYRAGTNRGFSHDQVMQALDRLRSETPD